MNQNQFSFKNLLDVSSITQSHSNKPSTAQQQQQSYKQKYLETKQSVKKFIEMVEKEFEKLNNAHNEEKNLLKREIEELKRQVKERKMRQKNQNDNGNDNDVSSFTVRSRKASVNTNEKSTSKNNRSMSQETNNGTGVVCFEGIEGFGDHSKIMSRTMKSIAHSSKSQTLIELQNALNNERNSSQSTIRQKSQLNNVLENLTQNDLSINSLNLNEYQSQVMGYRKNKIEKAKLKQKYEIMETLTVDKSLKSKAYEAVEQENQQQNSQHTSNRRSRQKAYQARDKENYSSITKEDQSKKAQQNSVRNILKNLRNTMKVNIEKESKLEGTTLRQ